MPLGNLVSKSRFPMAAEISTGVAEKRVLENIGLLALEITTVCVRCHRLEHVAIVLLRSSNGGVLGPVSPQADPFAITRRTGNPREKVQAPEHTLPPRRRDHLPPVPALSSTVFVKSERELPRIHFRQFARSPERFVASVRRYRPSPERGAMIVARRIHHFAPETQRQFVSLGTTTAPLQTIYKVREK